MPMWQISLETSKPLYGSKCQITQGCMARVATYFGLDSPPGQETVCKASVATRWPHLSETQMRELLVQKDIASSQEQTTPILTLLNPSVCSNATEYINGNLATPPSCLSLTDPMGLLQLGLTLPFRPESKTRPWKQVLGPIRVKDNSHLALPFLRPNIIWNGGGHTSTSL